MRLGRSGNEVREVWEGGEEEGEMGGGHMGMRLEESGNEVRGVWE